MSQRLVWDEAKRILNLAKHGLDFADAAWVLNSEIWLDVAVERNGEQRMQSLAYVYDRLRVLTVVHVPCEEVSRIVSFRTASALEREAYHDWLKEDDA